MHLTNTDTEQRLARLSTMTTAWRGVETGLTQSRTQDVLEHARAFVRYFGPGWRWPTIVAENYVNLNEGKRTCLGIIGIHAVIFVAWQLPPLQGFASKYLWHHPLVRGRLITHLTSVFSHRGLLHLGFNSLALYSIAPPAMQWLHRDSDLRSTSRYEFLAFYVAAGLLSSLTSHLWSILYLLPRITAMTSTRMILPSLGASGAIYGALAITALAYPAASVSLIFLPWVPIPIGTAFWGMVGLDVLGLLRGWKLLDHAAHLGGAVSGIAYFYVGHAWFDEMRRSWRNEKPPPSTAVRM
ncbi:hypothetical protein RQP46_001211 [Phenoliferia psychrophenolica]